MKKIASDVISCILVRPVFTGVLLGLALVVTVIGAVTELDSPPVTLWQSLSSLVMIIPLKIIAFEVLHKKVGTKTESGVGLGVIVGTVLVLLGLSAILAIAPEVLVNAV